MFGETFSRDKPLLEVGVLGPPGCGKTTLVQALAARVLHRQGRPAPRLRPGVRLVSQPRTVEYETPSRRYRLLDWPGESERVHGMVDRLGGLDGAVLVASAAEGSAGLLRRQIWLARQVSVPYLIVFLSGADAAGSLPLEALEAEVRLLLHAEGYPGDDAPVIAGDGWNALCSAGKSDAVCRPIDDVLAALDLHLVPPAPAAGKPFRMTVEEVSYLRKGLFAVATGRIHQGRVEVGNRVAVVGPREPAPTARVAGLRLFHRSLESASAGDRVGVQLRRRLAPPLEPGQILCRPGAVGAPRQFEAVVYQPPPANGRRPHVLFSDGPVHLGFGVREANGRCRVVDGYAVVSGCPTARVCVELDAAAAVGVYEGLRFELRYDNSVAHGVVARVL